MKKIYDFLPGEDMQFVVKYEGKEVDWIDPVCEMYETSDSISVINPYGEYTFKKPCDYVVRKRISFNGI